MSNNSGSDNFVQQPRKQRPMLINYGCVATEKRYQLIEQVYKNSVGIKEAAEQIGINY